MHSRPRLAAIRLPGGAARALPVAALALSTACAGAATRGPASRAAAPYDLVITNARVVDGTGNPWFWADVAIRGDRVARVAPRGLLAGAPARERVDAAGRVVAPGFIDIQSHSWDALLWADGRVVGKVAQGVTTEILGEGTTPAPVNDAVLALIEGDRTDSTPRALHRTFRGRRGFGAWLDAMDRHPKSVNVGSYLGATTVRAYAMGPPRRRADAAELDTMRRVVDDAMRDGAVGSPRRSSTRPAATRPRRAHGDGRARCAGAARTSRTCGPRAGACSRPPTRRWPSPAAARRRSSSTTSRPRAAATGPRPRARRQDRLGARGGMDVTATMYPYAGERQQPRGRHRPRLGRGERAGCWTTSATPPRAGACSPR
jgi:hypothetical protein